MAFEVKVPSPGESVTEVIIDSWLKGDGETVARDEAIAEVQSDKAMLTLYAETSGTLQIKVQAGQEVQVGAVVAVIEENGAAGNGKAQPAAKQTEEPAPQKQIAQPVAQAAPSAPSSSGTGEVFEVKVPSPGESVTEVIIDSWLKSDGDAVRRDEPIAEIQSDKAMLTLYAEKDGVLHTQAKAGDTVQVGAVVATIAVGAASSAPAQPVAQPAAPPASGAAAQPSAPAAAAVSSVSATSPVKGFPSPSAQRLMEERGITADQLQGSGPGGRITKADVLSFKGTPKGVQPSVAPTGTAPAAPAGERNSRREKMTALRRTIGKRLVSAKNDTAMLTTFNEVDLGAIMDARKQYKDQFEKAHGVKLGFMGFFAKAVCQALKEWPAVNAYIDGDEIEYHDYVDLGIAVSTDRGLVVPVVRNADQLSLWQIEEQIGVVAKKARDGKLSIEEMTGGTYTITNGGVFGSLLSTPILNPPQSAILGMHKIEQRPVVVNGEIKARPMMYVAMSYDHRIIDGRESVSFLVRVKEMLEDPIRLILEM